MHPQLETPFASLQAARQQLMALLSTHTAEELNFRASPGEWSMLQVAQHLIIAETMGLSSVKKGLQRQQAARGGLRQRLSSLMLRVILALPIRIKAPMQELNPPNKTLDLKEIQNNWEKLHESWAELLSNYPEEALSKNVFKHPIAGPLNIRQSLKFMKSHIEHHLQQVDRIRRKLPQAAQSR